MKRFIQLLFVSFFISYGSHALGASACDAGKGVNNSEAIADCIQQEADSKGWMQIARSLVTKQQIVVAVYILKSVTGLDFIDKAEQLEEKNDAGSRQLKGIEYVMNVLAIVFFIFVYFRLILKTLMNSATKGFAMSWSVFPFSAVTFIIAIAVATGNFTVFIKIAFVFVILMAYAIFFGASIFSFLASDTSGVATRLNSQAHEFSQEIVYNAIEWHIQDLTARKGMLVESGNIENSYIGVILKDRKFTDCLMADLKPSSAKSANKMYFPTDIEKTQYCGAKELGYNTYTIGYISDLKDTDESVSIFYKFISNQPQYREVADEIIATTCGSVHKKTDGLVSDFNSLCLDLKPNGFILIGDNGKVDTLQYATVTDYDVMKAKIDKLVDEYALFVYTEMLKNANKIDKNFNKEISLDNLLGNFQIGADYKVAYEAAGMRTIDVKMVTQVAIKKSKLQQGLGIEENLDIFGGSGTNVTFGINAYFASLKPQLNMNAEIVKLLDGLLGNSLSDLGLQYADCFKEKGHCNSGTVNFVTPLIETAQNVIPWVAKAYVAALLAKTYNKKKADSLDKNDPDRNVYLANERFYDSLGSAFIGIMVVIGVAFLFLLKVLILDYAGLLLRGFMMPIIVPYAFGYALIMSTYSKMFQDDSESLTDMLKKYGVYDVCLRLPLVVIGLLIGMCVMLVMMFIASICLATIYGGFAADNSGAGTLTLALKAIYFVTMTLLSFIASFVIGMGTAFKCTQVAIDELCGNAVKFDDAVRETVGKFKEQVSKITR